MWKLFALMAVASFVSVFADKVVFKDCGSAGGTIADVDITPCPSEPCQFQRSKTINVTVSFKANEAITTAKTKVYGFILGIKTPFPVPGDACQNMTCPIASGAAIDYVNSVYVNPAYPKVSVVVQWEVLDQNDKFIFCFNVPVQISD